MTLVITHAKVTSGTIDNDVEVDLADWNDSHTLTGVISPAQGGTGIVNNDSSTLTISGAFGTTFTVSATTSLTLPTTGTLATLAGSEALTNKTYEGNTWTAGTGTLTLGAGKTFTVSNTLTFTGTDASSVAFGAGGTVLYNGGALGTPSSGTLTNCTGLPISTGLTGAGTGVLVALAVNVGSAGAFVTFNGALGTPSSGTLTNATGLPVSTGISGLGTGIATFLATPSSANLASAVTDETGSGALVFATSPTLSNPVVGTQSPGDNTTKAASTAFVTAAVAAAGVSSIAGNTGAFTLSHGLTNSTNDIQIDIGTQRGYLAGLTLSTAGSSSTFSVAAGVAVDDAQTDFMKLTSSISKTTSAWAVGTGNGALDTGSIANSTWYHVYQIKRPDTGVVDILISTSASAPTMPTNYTLKRRIGSMKTNGSAQWTKFIQDGDIFMWDVPVNDVNATNPGTAAVTRTLTVPTGVRVQAQVAVGGTGTSSDTGPAAVYVSDLSLSDQAASQTGAVTFFVFNTTTGGIMGFMGQAQVMTNTSAQIRSRVQSSSANSGIVINTSGWRDTRGKDS